MQVIAEQGTPENFFFIGLRAPAGGAGTDGVAEKVAVIILKQRVQADGSIDNAQQVLQTDEPYDATTPEGPFKFESDLVPGKPDVDLVVTETELDNDLPFGHVAINRGSGFTPDVALDFGWLSRTEGDRLDDAGDNLDSFSPTGDNLPESFNNAFFNGRPLAGEGFLTTGNQVRFTRAVPLQSVIVEIPVAPVLTVTQDGEPIAPPVSITLGVDTVTLDWLTKDFYLTWHGVFDWQESLELAVLEIS